MKTYFTLFVLICCSAFAFSSDKIPDLSGSWVLDNSKEYPATRLTLVKVDIKQTADSLHLIRTYTDPRGDNVEFTENMAIGGETVHTEYQGIPRASSVTWSENKAAMVINIVITFTRNDQTREAVTLETWRLKDADTLTLERVNPSVPKDEPIVYYFHKK